MHSVGVVGLGVMGQRMVKAMQAHPRFEVTRAFDPRPPVDLLVQLAASAEAVILSSRVDCVYIATPPAMHEQMIRIAARAKKVVFSEKPLAASVVSARTCVDLLASAGVAGAVNFPFATAPAAVRLAELVTSGALGEVHSARLRLRFRSWPRDWQGGAGNWLARPEEGGFLREVASHFVFLANRLFGKGRVGYADVDRNALGTEQRVHARIRYANVLFEIDGAVEGDDEDFNRFEIVGTNGTAALTDWYRLDYAGGSIEPERPDRGQIDELGTLLEGRASRLASFAEAAEVVDLIETIIAVEG